MKEFMPLSHRSPGSFWHTVPLSLPVNEWFISLNCCWWFMWSCDRNMTACDKYTLKIKTCEMARHVARVPSAACKCIWALTKIAKAIKGSHWISSQCLFYLSEQAKGRCRPSSHADASRRLLVNCAGRSCHAVTTPVSSSQRSAAAGCWLKERRCCSLRTSYCYMDPVPNRWPFYSPHNAMLK